MSMVFALDLDDLTTDEGKTVSASTCKFILLSLADHANGDGENAYPSVTLLEKKTSLSRQTVISALNALRKAGYISQEGISRRGTNNYSIALDALVNTVDQGESTQLTSTSQHSLLKPSSNHPSNLIVVDAQEKNIFQLYEENIGPLTPMIREMLQEAEKEYPAAWIEAALKVAIEANARNWRFVNAVLRNWKTNGFMAPRPGTTYTRKHPVTSGRSTPYIPQTPEQTAEIQKNFANHAANEADWDEWIANRKKESVNA